MVITTTMVMITIMTERTSLKIRLTTNRHRTDTGKRKGWSTAGQAHNATGCDAGGGKERKTRGALKMMEMGQRLKIARSRGQR